jgi:hypothetical protein
MVLEEETKIVQSRNAYTQYIVIPAAMVRDSQYPFRANERVRITIDPYRKMMIITSVQEAPIKVSREGILVGGKSNLFAKVREWAERRTKWEERK